MSFFRETLRRLIAGCNRWFNIDPTILSLLHMSVMFRFLKECQRAENLGKDAEKTE